MRKSNLDAIKWHLYGNVTLPYMPSNTQHKSHKWDNTFITNPTNIWAILLMVRWLLPPHHLIPNVNPFSFHSPSGGMLRGFTFTGWCRTQKNILSKFMVLIYRVLNVWLFTNRLGSKLQDNRILNQKVCYLPSFSIFSSIFASLAVNQSDWMA